MIRGTYDDEERKVPAERGVINDVTEIYCGGRHRLLRHARGTGARPEPSSNAAVACALGVSHSEPGLSHRARHRDIPALLAAERAGFNSDEAVYAGQAASIAGQEAYLPYFPIFRAHPLLFQSLLSLPYRFGVADVVGRILAAAFGVATLVIAYQLGKLLYGRRAGIVAMALLALMPYHVTVSRQVLLDAPMVFFATAALYALVRYCSHHGARWLDRRWCADGPGNPDQRDRHRLVRRRLLLLRTEPDCQAPLQARRASPGGGWGDRSCFPLTLRLAGATRSGGNYLAWQLFRRANHPIDFYVTSLPMVIGPLVLALAVLGLMLDRKQLNWREGLLVSWCAVPIVFFTLMPIKGFQYLLPLAPALAVLAARALTSVEIWSRLTRRIPRWRTAIQNGAVVLTVLTLIGASVACHPAIEGWRIPGWKRRAARGSGGRHLDRQQHSAGLDTADHRAIDGKRHSFYGHRQAYGLSVSPNPLNPEPFLHRNRERGPPASRRRDPVRSLGYLLGRSLAEFLRPTAGVRAEVQRHRHPFGDGASQGRQRIHNHPASHHHLRVAPMRKFLCWPPHWSWLPSRPCPPRLRRSRMPPPRLRSSTSCG